MNFNHLKLKKLICTCYAGSPVSYTEFNDLPLFRQDEKMPYKIEITEVPDMNGDGATDLSDIELLLRSNRNNLTILDGDGSFQSEESIEFLKESDIVVTNPPFSLFREYVSQLIDYGKQFLILGTMNATHYKEIFPLIRDNMLWTGYSFNKTMEFSVPDYYDTRKSTKTDSYKRKIIKVPAICWFTNLDTQKRHDGLILYKKYSESEYPKYENYDAIEVKSINDIPDDYYGDMGVPDSFLGSYNPEQFEIIGLGNGYLGQSIGVGKIKPEHKKMMTSHAAAGDIYYLLPNGVPKIPYSRIIIRRRKSEN